MRADAVVKEDEHAALRTALAEAVAREEATRGEHQQGLEGGHKRDAEWTELVHNKDVLIAQREDQITAWKRSLKLKVDEDAARDAQIAAGAKEEAVALSSSLEALCRLIGDDVARTVMEQTWLRMEVSAHNLHTDQALNRLEQVVADCQAMQTPPPTPPIAIVVTPSAEFPATQGIVEDIMARYGVGPLRSPSSLSDFLVALESAHCKHIAAIELGIQEAARQRRVEAAEQAARAEESARHQQELQSALKSSLEISLRLTKACNVNIRLSQPNGAAPLLRLALESAVSCRREFFGH